MTLARAAVATTELQDSAAAGAHVAASALSQLAGLPPRLALLFCTSRHDPDVLLAAVHTVLGADVPVIGGFAVGTITHDSLGYDGYQVGLAVIGSDTPLPVTLAREPGLAGREHDLGARLGAALGPTSEGDSLLLFYDTVKSVDGKPALNLATPLLAGLSATTRIPDRLAGMGTLGDMQLHPTRVFDGASAAVDTAAALLLRPPLRMDVTVLHGCKPAGRYYEITSTDNQVVLEIDHRPALDVIGEMLGAGGGDALAWEDYAFFVTLGVNRGDPFGTFREEDYANRMCIGIDAERKGLVMFENDLVPGMKVQLMRRAIDTAYIPDRVATLLKSAEGRTPLLCFYIDCAGRAAAYSGMDEEEADAVRTALPKHIPLFGVYSGVEIARIGNHPQALDWTGVLCLLTLPA